MTFKELIEEHRFGFGNCFNLLKGDIVDDDFVARLVWGRELVNRVDFKRLSFGTRLEPELRTKLGDYNEHFFMKIRQKNTYHVYILVQPRQL